MKKTICMLLAVMTALLCACGAGETKDAAAVAEKDFVPACDTEAQASVTVAGSYNNFESLEEIFKDFNEIYPNVELTYRKVDDYNNMIGTILDGGDAPNIYVTYSWMQGRDLYAPCFAHAEDLSDPALGLDLGTVRPSLLCRAADGTLPMVPVFATTHGMLVNNDLFEKEGLKVPATYTELLEVCAAFLEKGYASPMLGFNGAASSSFANSLAYPLFCSTLAEEAEAVAAANGMDPAAGEYMRPALEKLQELRDHGCFDLTECAKLEDGYNALILRFFEGDIPMLICTGDTVSGTQKRESQSEAFTENPFAYSFVAVPMTEEGGPLLDTSSVQFSVNKDCGDLDMTNEFMRFLLSTKELNRLAQVKRLVTTSIDLTYDDVYAALADMPGDRIVCPEAAGISDDAAIQLRLAAFSVLTGEMDIDTAVANYGSFVKE